MTRIYAIMINIPAEAYLVDSIRNIKAEDLQSAVDIAFGSALLDGDMYLNKLNDLMLESVIKRREIGVRPMFVCNDENGKGKINYASTSDDFRGEITIQQYSDHFPLETVRHPNRLSDNELKEILVKNFVIDQERSRNLTFLI